MAAPLPAFDLSKLNDFFTKLSKQERLLFFIAAGFVALMLTDRVLLGPILENLRGMDEKIRTEEEAIKRDRRIQSFSERILDKYSQYSAYLDSGKLSPEEIISALLKRIEVTAKRHKITVKNIQPGDTEKKPLYLVYKTGIETEGTLGDMLTFMGKLEQSDYLFQINHYDIAPKSKGAEVVKCVMDISRIIITAEKLPEGASSRDDDLSPGKPSLEALPDLGPLPSDEAGQPQTNDAAVTGLSDTGSGESLG